MHVITQNCCNDAACVAACPVGCIHPTPDEPGYDTAEILYIDPEACIDCGACIAMCPVDAIRTADDLGEHFARYPEINAFYAADQSEQPRPLLRIDPKHTAPQRIARLRVAIVGAGPAGLYAAEDLLTRQGVDVEVDVFDRLPTPLGLIRAGVAPDHQATKDAGQQFRWTEQRAGFRYHLGIEVGSDITPAELAAHFHAVIYTHGASADRRLDIPGEHLPGSHSAAEFVAWYNGHPDFADRSFDLSGERAVIAGNGNVALDIARILLADPEKLGHTDIADHALDQLRTSQIREVVVLGRRGPAEAAYTAPELEALFRLDDVDVVLQDADLDVVALQRNAAARLKTQLAAELAARPVTGASKRLVLRYLRSPVEVLGTDKAVGLRIARNTLHAGPDGTLRAETTTDTEILDAGLVVRAIGHRGVPLPGLPFDDARGVIPNREGRVVDSTDAPMTGTYTAGWIKRGPSGVIGTNKKCATQTADRLLDDARAGRLSAPERDRRSLDDLLRPHRAHHIDRRGWAAIDHHERNTGAETGRPRVKLTTIREMRRIAGVLERTPGGEPSH